jgi:hypothetical protein
MKTIEIPVTVLVRVEVEKGEPDLPRIRDVLENDVERGFNMLINESLDWPEDMMENHSASIEKVWSSVESDDEDDEFDHLDEAQIDKLRERAAEVLAAGNGDQTLYLEDARRDVAGWSIADMVYSLDDEEQSEYIGEE